MVKNAEGIFWSGYMVFYTRSNPKVSTRYWKLNAETLSMFKSYNETSPLFSLPLSAFTKATMCAINTNDPDIINGQKCYFKLNTTNNIYFCGLDPALKNNSMNVLAGHFFNMFKMAFLPYRHTDISKKMSVYQISAPSYEETVRNSKIDKIN